MSAACLSSLVLGSFMCFLVLMCRRFGRDPGMSPTHYILVPTDDFSVYTDNIAPPIASCLGDLVTLTFLGLVSALLIRVINTPIPLVLGVIVLLLALTCATFTLRNPLVKPLIRQGWSPLFGAMVISSGTGIVLDLFVNRYQGFALLAIAISGQLFDVLW
jgi:solute carrier family 41